MSASNSNTTAPTQVTVKPPTSPAPRLPIAAHSRIGGGPVRHDEFNREFASPTPGPDILASRLVRLLAGPDVQALVAGDPPVGFALLTFRPNVWYDGPVGLLDELYVVPPLRSQGIGSALLHVAEAATRHRGGELLEINVDGQDIDARRFYERHGYAHTEPGQSEPSYYYYRELVGI